MGHDSNTESALKDLASGSIAGVTGKVVEFPFDTVKLRLQTQPIGPTGRGLLFHGAIDCFGKTVRGEGVSGLYKGLSTPLFGSVVENAFLFMCYGASLDLMRYFRHGTTSRTADLPPPSMTDVVLAGLLSGAGVSFILTPVELVKCKLQVQDVVYLHPTETPLVATTTAATGATAATSETRISASKSAPKASTVFTTSTSRHHIQPTPIAAASTSTRSYTTPSSRPPRLYTGPASVILHTLRKDGFFGMYRGHLGTFLRESGGGGAWFGVYELAVRAMVSTTTGAKSKADLATWQLMLAGALAGMAFNGVLFPADVVKSRMQTEEIFEKGLVREGAKKTFGQAMTELYRSEGLMGLYRGFGITMARSAPTSAVIFLTYETCARSNLFGRKV
ncbi:mitochondrial carrier domain-containing protein [Cladochytrium replicatum]|nr:mitochondrial carrier domain-containing protein [Cladochytrium replicatum]